MTCLHEIYPIANERIAHFGATLWSRTTKNPDESAEQLARPFALSLASLNHSRASGKVNNQMFQNDLVLSHSVPKTRVEAHVTSLTVRSETLGA